MYGEANRGGWERTKVAFRRMREATESHHAQLLVAFWPLLVGLEQDYPFRDVHERLTRVLERQGTAHLDLLGVLQGQPTASLWAHPADRHPSGKAHAMAAESLAPVVRRMLETPTAAEAR
jgi:hypothetical protein